MKCEITVEKIPNARVKDSIPTEDMVVAGTRVKDDTVAFQMPCAPVNKVLLGPFWAQNQDEIQLFWMDKEAHDNWTHVIYYVSIT